ncbi:ATP-binding protein [Pseudoalteromonas denitrificans]|uniref:DNA replication protein DnaC n=1 Tax=Pseudoalteromonas denitrificans DSM 6059 TaxID=1123010 RepID=A0A1I1IEY4_9GAMM|nr:ATP-binding protein [Pseudoalteromonas denitrificans]SFC31770.1 DNA replication protein DnaC [Pseudoalteromonas denitrificans DSM 6059]
MIDDDDLTFEQFQALKGVDKNKGKADSVSDQRVSHNSGNLKKLMEKTKLKHLLNSKSTLTYEQLFAENSAKGLEDSARLIKEGKQRQANALMKSCDVDLDSQTFSNFNAEHQWQHEIIQIVSGYATDAIAGKGNLNLVLSGEYGSGKTHLGCAVLNLIKQQTSATVLAKQFSVLVSQMWSARNNPIEAERARNSAQEADVLMLDEIGAAERTLIDGYVEELGALIRIRNNNKKLTILTTNFGVIDFSKNVGKFATEALKGGGCTFAEIMRNKNHRMRPPFDVYEVGIEEKKEVPQNKSKFEFQPLFTPKKSR